MISKDAFQNWAIVVAIGKNREIGKNNDLLWRLSDDLKRFKSITTGHTIVMGRKTFDSLPKGALPNRRNIVLSHQKTKIEGVEVYNSIDDIVKACENDDKIFVIGGASLYQLFIDKVKQMHLTTVDATFEADVFFPNFNFNEWQIVEKKTIQANDKNEYNHTYYHLKKG
jgi:dihydrofolate reductase